MLFLCIKSSILQIKDVIHSIQPLLSVLSSELDLIACWFTGLAYPFLPILHIQIETIK